MLRPRHVFVLVVVFFGAASAAAQVDITRGQTQESTISAAGQWVEVDVSAADVELELTVRSPRDQVVASATTKYTRRLSFVASDEGDYRLVVHAPPRSTNGGRYSVTVRQRAAAADDAKREDAQRVFLRAAALLGEQKAASTRAAVVGFEEALGTWRELGDRWREAETLHALGLAHARLTKHRQAIVHYERALALRRELSDAEGEAAALDGIGFAYEAVSELPKAKETFDAALALYRRLGLRGGEARQLTGLGAVLPRIGKGREAFEPLDAALRIDRELGDRAAEVMTLRWIGNAWLAAGEKGKAREIFEQALAFARELGDRAETGLLLNNIAITYGYDGQWERAIAMFEQAATLYAEGGLQAEEAGALINIGVAWGSLGEHARAIEFFERALPISRALGDSGRETFILVYLGISRAEAGDKAAAMQPLTAGLELSRKIGAPRIEALAHHHLGKISNEAHRFEEAVAHYEKALQIMREAGNRRGEVHALINVGSALGSMGRCDAARARLDEALAVARQTNDRVSEGATLSRLAQLDRDEGDLHQALAGIEAAVEIAEALRARSTAQQFRTAYLATVRDQYDLQIDILMHLHARAPSAGFDVAALLASQRARARSLVETLEEAQTKVALYDPATLTLAEIQQLLDDDTMLLEYSLGPHRSYVWAVTAGSLRSYTLPRRPRIDALARRVHALASARTTSPARRREVEEDYRAAAAELSAMILGPLAGELRGQRLVIAAESGLQYVPFAALPSPLSHAPLVASHEIVNVPSAATLQLLRREPAHAAPAKTLMVFADPVFSASDPRVDNAKVRTAAAMPRLPLTRLEAGSIARLVPRPSVTTALDFDASRTTATGDLVRRHRIVHFATHGVLDSVRPEQSGIVLSLVDRKGQPQDGFLRLSDVYDLRLDADLVVLSACQTALGKEIRGEGLVGLTRGFMHAGVPRVVASLWKVDDRATAELMRRFYEGMLGPQQLPPATALRAAQREMAESAAWSRPYYWAAFVLQGEWR